MPHLSNTQNMSMEKIIYALGFFDGVHLGHQALLAQCRALADNMGAKTAAITFSAHPKTLTNADSPSLINAVHDRETLLRRYGMDSVVVLPVTNEVMSTLWQDFLCSLMERGAVGFVCGDDFRFGFRGEGTSEKLLEFCHERAIPCVIVPEQALDSRRISSTYIRTKIECGDMQTAVRFLGHPHLLSGEVCHGQQIGRTIGIPTANLLLPENTVVPKFGVYLCRCTLDGCDYAALTNIGTRPTVSGSDITVEPWLIGYDGDLYGRRIELEFYRFLRPEMKFPSLEALRAQIMRDAEQARAFFAPHSP